MVWHVPRKGVLMVPQSTASPEPQMQMLARLMAAWALIGAGSLAWQGLHRRGGGDQQVPRCHLTARLCWGLQLPECFA